MSRIDSKLARSTNGHATNGHATNGHVAHAAASHAHVAREEEGSAPMPATSAPTLVRALAELTGVTLTPALPSALVRVLVRPLANHVAVMQRALALLPKSTLHVPKLDPVAFAQVLVEREAVGRAENALETVLRSASDRRLILDDQIMKTLAQMASVVRGARDEELATEWSFVTDFVGQFGRIGARVANAKAKSKKSA